MTANAVQTAVVKCPKSKVGRVIGKGGETIKALQNYTGAMIQIDQSADPTRVTVAGSVQSLQLAVSMIQDIVEGHFKGFAMLRQVSGSKESGGEAPAGVDPVMQPQPVYVEGYGFVPPSQLQNTSALLPHSLSRPNLDAGGIPELHEKPGLLWQALNDSKTIPPELLLQSLANLHVDTQGSRPASTGNGSPEVLTPLASMPSIRTRSPSPPSTSSLWSHSYIPAHHSVSQLHLSEPFARSGDQFPTEHLPHPATSLDAASLLLPAKPGIVTTPALNPATSSWMSLSDPDGRQFYFNSVTGQSQWELPLISALGTRPY